MDANLANVLIMALLVFLICFQVWLHRF